MDCHGASMPDMLPISLHDLKAFHFKAPGRPEETLQRKKASKPKFSEAFQFEAFCALLSAMPGPPVSSGILAVDLDCRV
jgi:hypothetical protein